MFWLRNKKIIFWYSLLSGGLLCVDFIATQPFLKLKNVMTGFGISFIVGQVYEIVVAVFGLSLAFNNFLEIS